MIVYGPHIRPWVSQQIFGREDGFDEKCVAIGVERNHQLIAGVVYSDYRPAVSIEISIASVDKCWGTRHNIRVLLGYPFTQLKLKRAQCFCSVHNEGAITILERLGFKIEGRHRYAYHNGDDALSYAMLAEECHWLKEK